jgi:hypothetical protein
MIGLRKNSGERPRDLFHPTPSVRREAPLFIRLGSPRLGDSMPYKNNEPIRHR